MAPPSCLFLSLRQTLPLVPRRSQEKRGLSSPSTPRRISLRKKGRVLLPPLASGVTLGEVDVVELGRVLKDDLAGDLLQNSDKVLLGGSTAGAGSLPSPRKALLHEPASWPGHGAAACPG